MQDLLIISGCTAVGKSAFALSLSKFINMEIVSADSIQVYRGVEIATSKPTKAEEKICPHHLINIVSPFETFNAFDFVQRASVVISEIAERGNLPVVVGGTGLYIDSLIYGFDFDGNKTNTPKYNTRFIFIEQEKPQLYRKINKRVDQMIENGLIDEVKTLRKIGLNLDCQCMQAIGYREIWRYLEGEITQEEAINLIKQNTRNYAKRQITWFNHNDCERWNVKDLGILNDELVQFYAKYKK